MAKAVDLFRCYWKKPCLESTIKLRLRSNGFVPLNPRKVTFWHSLAARIMERNIKCKVAFQNDW